MTKRIGVRLIVLISMLPSLIACVERTAQVVVTRPTGGCGGPFAAAGAISFLSGAGFVTLMAVFGIIACIGVIIALLSD